MLVTSHTRNVIAVSCVLWLGLALLLRGDERPNILLAISDDQSYPHASVYGAAELKTPAFDRVARMGVLFHNAYSGSPGCSPSRAVLLTGRDHWSLAQAGTHASSFPARFVTLPDLLEPQGYHVGYTGKGWGPGDFKISGRSRNPAGPGYQARKLADKSPTGVSGNDYAANFSDFLEAGDADQPFFFWFGAHEPHRGFEAGSGLAAGKDPARVSVPGFLPDNDIVRSDLLDYYLEIEHFDQQLARMIELLEERGELENTLIIVTSDNGMPFPRAKANCYDAGVHVPLAISWPRHVAPAQEWHSAVGFVDLHRTVLAAAQVTFDHQRRARDLVAEVRAGDPSDGPVCFGRERHSSSRWNNLGYPQRGIRQGDYLYIRNFHPERWPAGAPQKFNRPEELGPMHGGYHDIDACPTLTWLIRNQDTELGAKFLELAVGHRSEAELFDLSADPDCLHNLIDQPQVATIQAQLEQSLGEEMRLTGDPRAGRDGEVFEGYPRYSPLRSFPRPAWANAASPD